MASPAAAGRDTAFGAAKLEAFRVFSVFRGRNLKLWVPMMLAKIICVINLGYVATTVLSFILFRFQTAALWGNSAFVNLGFQILFACLFFLSRRTLSTGWKMACGGSVVLNLILVGLGVLFMNTYVGAP